MTISTATGPAPGFQPRPHWLMALWITFGVLFGFGSEAGEYFGHPTPGRPAIVILHSALATAWLALYLAQTTLIAAHARALHRKLGMAGLWLGLALIPVSLLTALAMSRFNVANHLAPGYGFVAISLGDIALFTGFFALGMVGRQRPAWHRGAMFMAMLSLADAGFGRWPRAIATPQQMSFVLWATGAVMVVQDWRAHGRPHRVLVVGLPVLMASNYGTFALFQSGAPWWEATARWLSLLA